MKIQQAMALAGMFLANGANAQPIVNPASATTEGLIVLMFFMAVLWLVAMLPSLFKWMKTKIKAWVEGWKD